MRLKPKAIEARPFTRPDSLASRTVPMTSEPLGTTVVPETTIDLASVPRIGSSGLLVFDAIGVVSVTEIGVSTGTVISRNVGSGGAAGSRAAAVGAADAGAEAPLGAAAGGG